ncbi:MAG: hypothetical protein AAGC74_06780 [Verrucomicrobiota bacterium]
MESLFNSGLNTRAPYSKPCDLDGSYSEAAPSKIPISGTNTVTVLSNHGRRDFSADLSMFPRHIFQLAFQASKKAHRFLSLCISRKDKSFLTKTSSLLESTCTVIRQDYVLPCCQNRRQLPLTAVSHFKVLSKFSRFFSSFSFLDLLVVGCLSQQKSPAPDGKQGF